MSDDMLFYTTETLEEAQAKVLGLERNGYQVSVRPIKHRNKPQGFGVYAKHETESVGIRIRAEEGKAKKAFGRLFS